MKLSIIIPTLNERDNIEPLVDALNNILMGIDWEVVFVDDNSRDGTSDLIESLALKNSRVRCLKRSDRKGISSACIEGMNISDADYLAVMDADLQHDPKALREMFLFLQKSDYDLVIGSRYTQGGRIDGWPRSRILMSYVATWCGSCFVRIPVKDPLSGFFMFKRSLFNLNSGRLSTLGSKILLNLLVCSKNPIKFKEIPIDFKPRYTGLSKHNPRLVWENCLMVLNNITGHP